MEILNSFLRIKEELPGLESHELFNIGFLSFTSSTMMAILGLILFAILCYKASYFRLIPSKFQLLVEDLVIFLKNFITQIVGDESKAKIILPYVGSVFLFILFANLISLIPGLSSLTWGEHEIFTASTADFNTTFALALASVIVVNLNAVASNGLFAHLGHFIQIKPIIIGFRKSFADGMLGIINFFVGLIEIIGELAKVVSLSLRLFGNMFAHEVLTVILLGVFSVGIPAIWMGMGILVGVVQAIVFTALITVYYSLTLKKAH
jgi:F-type H+-transporting ATPase subunit a